MDWNNCFKEIEHLMQIEQDGQDRGVTECDRAQTR